MWGSGDPVDYLSSILTPKYISTVFRFGKPNPTLTNYWGYDGNVSVYVTGNGALYYDYPDDLYSKWNTTCGNKILKSYLFYFYDDQKLNLPTVGYRSSSDGGITWHFSSSEPNLTAEESTNWYCIGE